MNKKINIAYPYIDEDDRQAVLNVLTSNVLSLGPKNIEFEEDIAGYVGTKFACAVANGTCGLHLAVIALGLKEGDEVITTPFSFISSSNCLLYERVKPIFVDIEEQTYNIDPEKIDKAITTKTKAIIVVHIFGQTANMDKIMKIVKKHKLKVIEDACESLGAKFKNKMTGTFGNLGVFAFYPNKQITTGEGGIIVGNSKEEIDLCRSLRNQGRNQKNDWLVHERLGYNYRMDEMNAALGVSQLKKIDRFIEKRREIVGWYGDFLQENKGLILPQIGENRTHSWFVFVVRVVNGKRNFLMNKLAEIGIQTKPYLPVIHLQPFMKKMFSYKSGDFPVAENVASQTLALPIYVGLAKNAVKYICQKINNIL